MKHTLAIFALVASMAAFAEKQPFERYQSIIDRHPFGDPPPGFDPSRPPSEVSAKEAAENEKQLSDEQAQIQSAVHFSMINSLPDGQVAVGFTDNSDPKAPVNYYLKVGEKRNGWEVKEADPLAATMKLAKGDVEVELTLGQKSGKAAPRGGASATPAAPASTRVGTRPFVGRGGRERGGPGGVMTMAERRRFREERAAAEEAERQEAEKRRAEREAKAEEDRQATKQEAADLRQQLSQIRADIEREKAEKTAAEKAAASEKESEGDGEDE